MAKALPLVTLDPEGKLSINAPLMLHIRLQELYLFSHSAADVNLVTELHNMRIAAKRLRYTMEIFATCFEEAAFTKVYDAVKKIQEQIGEIHDADVRIPVIEDHLSKYGDLKPEIQIGLKTLIQQQRAERARKFGTFVKTWLKYERSGFKSQFLQLLANTVVEIPGVSGLVGEEITNGQA